MEVITDFGWKVRFKPLSMGFFRAPYPLMGSWGGINNNSAPEMWFLAPTHPYLEASLLSSITTLLIIACYNHKSWWVRLRVVPHFSSGIVERAKRERAWKSPHARKGYTRRVAFSRVGWSLALLSLEEKWGTTRSLLMGRSVILLTSEGMDIIGRLFPCYFCDHRLVKYIQLK